MTVTEADAVSSLEDLEVVVDADGHVRESVDELLPYVDDRYEGLRRIVERSKYPKSEIFTDNKVLPSPPNEVTVEGHEDDAGGPYTVDDKLREMDEFGIEYAFLSPGLLGGVNSINNSRIAVALSSAYNDYVLDNFLDESDRVKAAMVVPSQKPDRAAEEIDRRGGEDGVVAVQLAATGLMPPPGHEWYDPIYEAAEDNGLVVAMHSNGGKSSKTFPIQYWWNETYAEDHATSHPFSHSWNLTTMIMRGVPERFPDLEFVLQESGIGWIPYMKYRLDDHYMAYTDQVPAVEKFPSEYIDDQFSFTTQPLGLTPDGSDYVPTMIDMIGADNVLYSGDFPHHDFDPPGELFDRIYPHMDSADVRRVMGENAVDVFGL